MDTLTAARLQMSFSLIFHIFFAAVGIGMPLLLVLVEGIYLRTGKREWLQLARKWSKAVAMLFAVGAISGTALSFELGLLWPRFMEICGAVVGHIFGLEGFAFFLEAIFIGLYLYGWDRLSAKAHWWCGVVIAVSGMISGLLILGVNAWMQLPVGFEMGIDGRVAHVRPLEIYHRFAWFAMSLHSTLSSYMAVSFAVASVYALGWLRGRRDAYHKAALTVSLAVGGIAAILQPLSGDMLAKFVVRNEPAKFAAMEGQFHNEKNAPIRIGGWADAAGERTRFAIEVPGVLSMLAGQETVPGLLDAVPNKADWPPVALTHMAFQVMVGFGVLLVVLSIWFWVGRWRGTQGPGTVLAWGLVIGGFLGFAALQAGWMVTEVGRQPWVVTRILRTRDAVTQAGGVPAVFFLFTVLYVVLAVAVVGLLRYLAKQPVERHEGTQMERHEGT